MATDTRIHDVPLSALSTAILPGDPGYDEARQAFNTAVDQRPAAIAHPATAADVAALVSAARADGDLAHGERPRGVEQRVQQLILGERQITLSRRLVGDASASAAGRAHELAEGIGERLQLGVGGGRRGVLGRHDRDRR